ncbi:MAG: HAD family phosphatase [Oscillospiraceae bacterium]|nr:HAD family phosphatase [Oscillospiraceae bacterium]
MLSENILHKAKNIKLIVSDLDGTLFRSGKIISPETLDAVRLVREKGIDFTVNTGRSYTWLGGFIGYLGIGCPLISSNGCEITRGDTGERLYTAVFPEKHLDRCARFLSGSRLSWHIETADGWVLPDYIRNMDPFPGFYPDLELNGFSFDRVKTYSKAIIPDIIPLKFIIWIRYGNEGELLTELTKDMEGVDLLHSASNIYEILPSGVNKGSSFLRMCRIMGLDPSEVCTFGDFDNDLPMMESSGLSVAMKNAPDYVRARADMVTDTNNDEGVAKAIRRLFL